MIIGDPVPVPSAIRETRAKYTGTCTSKVYSSSVKSMSLHFGNSEAITEFPDSGKRNNKEYASDCE
jgi:hypothetical protein